MKTSNLSKIIILISIFLIGTTNIYSQIITIGNGTAANGNSSWPAPYGNYEYGTRYQIIIDASELFTAGAIQGDITAIAFDVSGVNNSSSLTNFTIRIGNSSKPNFEASNSWITGLTAVYTTTYQPVSGWNTHNFSNGFYWDGSSDIVIETCFYNGTYSYNASTRYTTTSQRMVVGSEGSFDPCNNTTTPYRYYERPNIKLNMQTSTGIDDININSEISVYPNPTKNKIHIKVSDNFAKNGQLLIFNSIGQLVYTNEINSKTSIIKLSNFNTGLYFIEFKTENKIVRKKFFVIE